MLKPVPANITYKNAVKTKTCYVLRYFLFTMHDNDNRIAKMQITLAENNENDILLQKIPCIITQGGR